MKTRIILSMVTVLIITTYTALAAGITFGSAGALKDNILSNTKMLTYAIQDEYLAKGEYDKIISSLKAARPFTNIIKSEATHISWLNDLFKTYKIQVPKNTADKYITIPKTLTDAYKAGVTAEKNNITMYEKFLKQKNLPVDIKTVFTNLKNASVNHLKSFTNALAGDEEFSQASKNGADNGNKGIVVPR